MQSESSAQLFLRAALFFGESSWDVELSLTPSE